MLELARAALVTRPRGHNQADQDAAFRVYANELAVFPIDVVVTAIRAGDNGWFPPLDLVKSRCAEAVRSRQRILAALKRPAPVQTAQSEWTRPNEDEKAQVSDMVAELT